MAYADAPDQTDKPRKSKRKERSKDDDDILAQAKEQFERCAEAEADNREAAQEDIKFARLGEHWPSDIRIMREQEGLPCLTIPILSPVIRQVVNDARQNKPMIKVGPVDSEADVETAKVYSDLIRNIESESNADIAYDTGIDCSVTSGVGYIRVGLDYAHDDSFDLDISINRVLDPFSIYGDPDSLGADSSDWNLAFVIDRVPKDKFEQQWGESGKVDWEADGYTSLKGDQWIDDDSVMVAEYWTREEVEREICRLSDGSTVSKEELDAALDGEMTYYDYLKLTGITIEEERIAKTYKVTQRRMSGAEILDEREWLGKYIPIIPVYGDEVFSEGKRYLRSLTRDAQDAQRNFNYWRSVATQLVALAPKVPWIGPEGFASADPNWTRANKGNIPFLEVALTNGQYIPPQRQPSDTGPAAGALQEALNASDDMKRITGIYDASLGARSNETSGKAINARKVEGDTSTFHFIDNQHRAIRHVGRVLIDLIPKVYGKRRIIRVRGEDGEHRMIPLKQPTPVMGPDGKPQMQPMPGPNGQPMMQPGPQGPQPVMMPLTRIYDLTVGKYDLTVKAGPSFTSRREEASNALTEAVRSVPQAAPVLIPEMFRMMDFPGADGIAQKLEALAPKPQSGPPPEIQKQMQQAQQQMQKLHGENEQLKQGMQKAQSDLMQAKTSQQSGQIDAAIKAAGMKLDAEKLKIEAFNAETERFKAVSQSHLDYMKVGLDAQLSVADLDLSHMEAMQHGIEGDKQREHDQALASTPKPPELPPQNPPGGIQPPPGLVPPPPTGGGPSGPGGPPPPPMPPPGPQMGAGGPPMPPGMPPPGMPPRPPMPPPAPPMGGGGPPMPPPGPPSPPGIPQ